MVSRGDSASWEDEEVQEVDGGDGCSSENVLSAPELCPSKR